MSDKSAKYCHVFKELVVPVRIIRFSMVSLGLPSSPVLRNVYEEYFLGSKGGRCVGLTTLPLSCADYLEIVRI